MQIQAYPLDELLLQEFKTTNRAIIRVSSPELSVVLGRATPIKDVFLERCACDGIPVYRRRGGGGAVVLHPSMLVVSACFPLPGLPDVSALMHGLASTLAQSLAEAAPQSVRHTLCVRGLGDVCVGHRKVAGSSLFLCRGGALYQASLIVLNCTELIERYLPMPSSMPDYRQGRSHREFLTSLEESLLPTDHSLLAALLQTRFEAYCSSLR